MTKNILLNIRVCNLALFDSLNNPTEIAIIRYSGIAGKAMLIKTNGRRDAGFPYSLCT